MGIIVFTTSNILYIPMLGASSYHGLNQIIIHHYEHVVNHGHKKRGWIIF
jgi:carbamoylphosphate synthase small subunit